VSHLLVGGGHVTSLVDLGWDAAWQAAADAHPQLVPARIAVEHRGAYEALGESGTVWAELRGNAYHAARDKRELPTVGDWVLLGEHGAIEVLLPRRTWLVRAAAGEKTTPQPIAANVDVAFVVTSANLDLNARRLERYLAAVSAGGATPVVVLNKIDLVDDPAPLIARITEVAVGVAVVAMSAARGDGIEQARVHLGPGRTAVVVGSSGVGKSTLLNRLLGLAVQEVQPVRADDDRGKHTTTRRALFVLEGGGVLVDTPGMRELKPWTEDDPDAGLGFTDVEALVGNCRFADCGHEREPGCAVRGAVEAGTLAADRVAAWKKLVAEQAAVASRRDAASKQRDKHATRALRQRLRDKGQKE
jgi:ribosome biogenesis GTPase